MNDFLELGFLLVVGYMAGWLCHKIRLPKIIGYIAAGIVFSPHTIPLIDYDFVIYTEPLIELSIAFIAFEVGGALKWSRIKKHEKEIVYITLLASFVPFIFIFSGILLLGLLVPAQLPFSIVILLLLAMQLGALASSTAPAATLAIMHEYKAKGKVTDTILGVVSLDDTLGIILFSLVINIEMFLIGSQPGLTVPAFFLLFYPIGGALALGICLAYLMMVTFHLLPKKEEGQWIVVIVSLIVICVGVCKWLHLDTLLAAMTMGIIIVNRSKYHHHIFRIIERYTEELIFLFFFILSGLHLNITTIPQALPLILLFVILRILGKYTGAWWGGKLAKSDASIIKHTAGGLIPQAGIVIGLVL
ncbi:MAG: cation:proton antiporter, partial [Marinilabiliaceae bacterium]|nr:cation:proton antiporter [Marinilabiliaceae bacterium]